jgi:hypothetical protein
VTYVGAPQWDYDLFISYARRDNRREFGRSPWIDIFRDRLLNEIEARLGYRMAGFFDEETDENPDASSFATWAARSAIFIPVITPIYLTRPYCKIEWDAFRDTHDGFGQILAVQPYPIPADLPRYDGLENIFPTRFFDDLVDRPRPFPLLSNAYVRKFDLFRDRVTRKLTELKSAYSQPLHSADEGTGR